MKKVKVNLWKCVDTKYKSYTFGRTVPAQRPTVWLVREKRIGNTQAGQPVWERRYIFEASATRGKRNTRFS